jgi:hypothetical protein
MCVIRSVAACGGRLRTDDYGCCADVPSLLRCLMTRLQKRLFTLIVIATLAAPINSCGGSNRGPMAPTSNGQALTPIPIASVGKITLPGTGTVTGTVRGDDLLGQDVLFGGLCAHTPCKVMEFGEFIGNPRRFELTLRWNDPTRQLALYKFAGDPDVRVQVQPGERYAGPSELVATVSVSGYYDAIAVAFEQAGDGPPGPSDSQPFELTVQPVR